MKFIASVDEFATRRRGIVEDAVERLRPVVRANLALWADGEEDWWDSPVGGRPTIRTVCAAIWDEIVADEGGQDVSFAPFRRLLEDAMPRTSQPDSPSTVSEGQVERIALWLASAVVNAATFAAADAERGEFVLLEWVTMGDEDVRDIHTPLQGVQRPVGETFSVGGFDLHYPGEPVGPPEVWINCRCVIRPVLGEEMAANTTFAVEDEDTDLTDAPMIDSEDDLAYEPVPVHGVLAPLNVMSGDRRKLTGDITWVEPPFAIRWVKQDSGMHQGAVRTATADEVWMEGDQIRWNGHMLASAEADEHMALLAEGRMGISVDMDSATYELQDENGNQFDFDLYEEGDPPPVEVVTTGRIRAATAVDIPAFTEAWMALGEWENETVTAGGDCVPCAAAELNGYYGDYIDFAISEQPWDGSASRFTIEEWRRSCLIDTGEGDEDSKSRYRLPIREPNGDINRAGVHAAAGRINQVEASDTAVAAGRRRLIAAYRAIDEEPPESLTASAFAPGTKDAPGWITHPRETARIRRYWTKGKGAAKIRWGVAGDFNRCRTQLAKYIKNPKWLAGTCANMHKEALGVWPGQERLAAREGAIMASAFTLVDEETAALPAAWFKNPNLDGPTPVTVTPEGRVYGHVALWETCHIGYGLSVKQGSDCVAPPTSVSKYAYFLTGVVDTDDGEIPTGVLTMGTGHAPERLRATPAAAHYDNTGMAVADVNVGEDDYGIWFSGAMRSGLTPEDVRAFKASSLSGDWRTIQRHHEMVAALVVNVPGFPIPRRSMAASGGRQTALVAAGVIHREEPEGLSVGEYTVDVTPMVDVDALIGEIEKRMERKERRLKARAAVRAFRIQAVREKIGQ